MSNVTPERLVKPAADLKPGDILASLDEVLYVKPYRTSAGVEKVLIACQRPGEAPRATRFEAVFEEVGLATDDEIAEAQRRSERDRYVADLRAFATWFEERPWLPVPYSQHHQAGFANEGDWAALIAEADALAEQLGVKAMVKTSTVTVRAQVGGVALDIYGSRPAPVAPAEDPTGTGFSREDLDVGGAVPECSTKCLALDVGSGYSTKVHLADCPAELYLRPQSVSEATL